MTQETPGKVLSLLGLAVTAMFFMTAVTVSNVTWSGNSGVAIADPFSTQNVMAVVDQVAFVYSNAVNDYFIAPAKADFAFIPDNLIWIKDNAELAIAVAVGLEDPLPGISDPSYASVITGSVAGATTDIAPYNDNVYTLFMRQ
jgi:hypothetical protein